MAHGSFLFFSAHALEILGHRPYDENLFLFAEEAVLAYRAKKLNLNTIYNRNIIVKHKEDGSMKMSNISINDEVKKSNLYFFKQYKYRSNNE